MVYVCGAERWCDTWIFWKNYTTGIIDPHEKDIKRGGEYAELAKLAVRNQAIMMEGLTETQKKLFTTICENNTEMSTLTELAGFKAGFCLGVRLVIAVMNTELPGEIQ